MGKVSRDHPDTSYLAAGKNLKLRGTQRLRVFNHVKSCGDWGSTDHESFVALNIAKNSLTVRRKELAEMGLLQDSSEIRLENNRRPTDTACDATVWVLTEKGKQYAGDFKKGKQQAGAGKPGPKAMLRLYESMVATQDQLIAAGDTSSIKYNRVDAIAAALGWSLGIEKTAPEPEPES